MAENDKKRNWKRRSIRGKPEASGSLARICEIEKNLAAKEETQGVETPSPGTGYLFGQTWEIETKRGKRERSDLKIAGIDSLNFRKRMIRGGDGGPQEGTVLFTSAISKNEFGCMRYFLKQARPEK